MDMFPDDVVGGPDESLLEQIEPYQVPGIEGGWGDSFRFLTDSSESLTAADPVTSPFPSPSRDTISKTV
jgi:hypothetical protein